MIIETPKQTDIPALRTLWKQAFGDTDAFLDTFFATAFSPDRSLLARTDGIVVGMLYWFDCSYEDQKIAYLYAIATHGSYRGRGICHSLMGATHRLLAESGYAGIILVPAEAHLFDFYGRMGYITCSHNSILKCTAENGAPLEMHIISAAEYAAQRTRLLPPHSVLQEGENLAFLQTLATFWQGEDFLLAVRKDAKELFGLELLGNTALAPRIVKMLGFEEGSFRIAGQRTPFAMFLSLNGKTASLPHYFAFAFD